MKKNFFYSSIGILTLAITIGCLYVYMATPPVTVPSYDRTREDHRRSDAILLDRNGNVLQELRTDMSRRSLDWVPLSDISPSLVAAVLASEDKRFRSHGGVDMVALFNAAVKSTFTGHRRGASTISMQLSAFLDKRIRPEKRRRDIGKKWHQIVYAWQLERSWSKDQILESYLNLVTFRGELQGISAASRGLFDKEPGGLDKTESIILASLIRAPNASIDAVLARARRLNTAVAFAIPDTELEKNISACLSRKYFVRKPAELAYHAARILVEPGISQVSSTIERDIQRYASELLKEHINELKSQNVRDGAILVVNNKTGEVLAYIGGSGEFSSAPYVDGIRAKRQAGSTLKPFLYALAFDEKKLTPASLLNDTPLDIPTERGIYRPENYDKGFRGLVSARIALASSLNVPAVRVLGLTGTDSFVDTLRALGFAISEEGEHYGHSLALGTLDVSLAELTGAYRALAQGGVAGTLTLRKGEQTTAGKRVFSHEASFLVTHILSDREARIVTFSLENPLATRFFSSVKTGTSKDMRDNWCVGYSDRYTVGVWVGNFSGDPMWNVSGISGAAPIWHDLMGYLHRRTTSHPPKPPPHVTETAIGSDNGSVGRKEWFINGTEPLSLEPARAGQSTPRIVYPPRDVIIAIDPDIPSRLQKVVFEAYGATSGTTWVLNGIRLGPGGLFPWQPVSGTHRLELVKDDSTILDEVTFIVR